MIEKTKKSLATGLTRVKWMAKFFTERTKAETSAAKLLFKCNRLESKVDDIYRDIGKRVAELDAKGKNEDKDLLKDIVIRPALDELKDLLESVQEYRTQAEDISKLPE